MAVFALMMAAALLGSEPDGVVTTAPATSVDLEATARPLVLSTQGATRDAVPHGLSTDQQIDRWIATRSTAETPWAEARDVPGDDREPHGEVSFGIGTGGYRDYGVAVSLPLGDNGRIDFSYRQVENGYPDGGFGYSPYYALDDDSGFGYPGYRPDAAAQFERGMMRPEGPLRRLRPPEQNQDGGG